MTAGKRRKKKLLVMLAFVILCCAAIIGTLAWLRWRTPEAVNTFTLGSGVKVELKEDKYNSDENKKRRENFTPGMWLDKDPTVYIPDVKMDEYIAVVVRYYIEEVEDVPEGNIKGNIKLKEVSYSDFQKYAEIYSFKETVSGTSVTGSVISSEDEENYSSPEQEFRNGWVHDAERRVFYYGSVSGTAVSPIVTTNSAIDDIAFTKVSSGDAITLFDKVKISNKYNKFDKFYDSTKIPFPFDTYRYTEGDYNDLRPSSPSPNPIPVIHKNQGELKGFRINIAAYAVQGNVDSKEGKFILNELIEKHDRLELQTD